VTADEYRSAIETLGLSQLAAAKLLGVDGRTSRRWVSGERDVPAPAARFLQYLIATRKTGDQAMRVLGSSYRATP
jgi:DNA-binding transcriptional regulator YiaG